MTDLASAAKERGIKFFLISFTDLFGVTRSKLVPASAIADIAADGAGFAGFAAWFDMSPADPDMLGMPDAEAMIQLPWKPEVAWVPADLVINDAPLSQSPRHVLRQLIAKAAEKGVALYHGVEPEYFLISPEGDALSDARDTQSRPCYDQQALMRRYDVVAEICAHMEALGWGPYQNDHEDANGQFEMNWNYADALTSADRHVFFKYMVKSVAENHGLRATFMPKPFAGLTGNGCHAHISLWNGQANVFLGEDELGLSPTAYHFLGGLMAHAAGLTAIANPSVNSYKRLNAPVTSSGATWSPNTVSWSGNNRTHMVRVPGPGRMELRLADGAVNPYLLPAIILAAGLDGIATKADPGPRLDIDMYTQAHLAEGVEVLPRNLLDALRAFEADSSLQAMLGEDVSAAFLKLKHAEWTEFMSHLSDWERARTLDC